MEKGDRKRGIGREGGEGEVMKKTLLFFSTFSIGTKVKGHYNMHRYSTLMLST